MKPTYRLYENNLFNFLVCYRNSLYISPYMTLRASLDWLIEAYISFVTLVGSLNHIS